MSTQKIFRQEMSRLYTDAANQLVKEFPQGWTHFCLGFFVDEEEHETMLVYLSMDDGKTWRDFMEDVANADYIMKGAFECKETCQKLWRLCKAHNSRWSVFTLLVNAQGGFSAEYDYESFPHFNLGYKQMWRGKYLG